MIRYTILFFTLGLLATPLPGQVEKPAAQPKSKVAQEQDARSKVLELLKSQGVSIDIKRKLVRAEGKIKVTKESIEYIAIGPRGKKHEALVVLKCLGSTLNTALALLRLPRGKNVRYEPIKPPPTQEEVENGAPTVKVIPPEGPKVQMALQWKGKDGKPLVYAIEDLVLDAREDKTLQDVDWIYYGGRMASLYRGEPPVYLADYEQNYISCYYVKPDNQLITIRHKRGNLDENWWPNQYLLPEPGTSCELIISLKPIVKRLPLLKAYPNSGKAPEPKEKTPKEDNPKNPGEGEKAGNSEAGKKGSEAGK